MSAPKKQTGPQTAARTELEKKTESKKAKEMLRVRVRVRIRVRTGPQTAAIMEVEPLHGGYMAVTRSDLPRQNKEM